MRIFYWILLIIGLLSVVSFVEAAGPRGRGVRNFNRNFRGTRFDERRRRGRNHGRRHRSFRRNGRRFRG